MTDTLKYIDVNPDDAKRMAQRMHVKKDDIRLVRKGYEVTIQDQDDDERTITARVSTADRDRDGEIVEPKGIELKDYHLNPVLAWCHKYDHPAVGKALWSKTDANGLICKFQFAETQFADELYQLYKGGFMKAFSIGFIPMEYDQKTKTHQKINLLEVSAVLVPANQSALVMEAYAKGLIKSEALIHDLELDKAPDADPPAPIAEPDVKAIEPEVKAEDVPVSEPTPEFMQVVDPTGPASPAYVTTWSTPALENLIVEVSTLRAAVVQLQADIAEAKATPAPLAEVPASPPPPVDDFDIEPDEDIIDIEPDMDILTIEPSAPKAAPNAFTFDEVHDRLAKAIAGLDLKDIVEKNIKLNLDRLRGRVR